MLNEPTYLALLITGAMVVVIYVAYVAPREPALRGYCEIATLAPIDSSCNRSQP